MNTATPPVLPVTVINHAGAEDAPVPLLRQEIVHLRLTCEIPASLTDPRSLQWIKSIQPHHPDEYLLPLDAPARKILKALMIYRGDATNPLTRPMFAYYAANPDMDYEDEDVIEEMVSAVLFAHHSQQVVGDQRVNREIRSTLREELRRLYSQADRVIADRYLAAAKYSAANHLLFLEITEDERHALY